jgi:hypothetical protein
MSYNCFHFVFFFFIDKIRGQFQIIGSMYIGFSERGKEVHMKYGMDLPLSWEFELISKWF